MAGGNFDPLVGKIRPGTYINFQSQKIETVGIAERGITVIPLIGHNYGPVGKFITLTNASPDSSYAELGYSVFENNAQMLLIREAFKKVQTVIVYIVSGEGTKATGTTAPLTVTAKYGGTRGNDIRYVVSSNPVGGKDVFIYLDTNLVESFEGVNTVEDISSQGSQFVEFSGTGNLAATEAAGVKLSNGTNGTVVSKNYTDFLDGLESIRWNTLAFPVVGDDASSLKTSCKSKIQYLIENVGRRVKAAIPDFAADYDGIINVTNAVKLDSGEELTNAQACAYVAAMYAGAGNTESNTYREYVGAVDVKGKKTHEQAVAAINNGEFFFSFSETGKVIVEYDINSLITFGNGKDSSYRKNRVQRVFDTFAEWLLANFPPNKFSNDEIGWDIMEGIGKGGLMQFYNDGAIKNVDVDNDFLVDRTKSQGDQTYFNIGLQPVDSAEKLYFSIKTQ